MYWVDQPMGPVQSSVVEDEKVVLQGLSVAVFVFPSAESFEFI